MCRKPCLGYCVNLAAEGMRQVCRNQMTGNTAMAAMLRKADLVSHRRKVGSAPLTDLDRPKGKLIQEHSFLVFGIMLVSNEVGDG
jgi:hypothetical protein